MAVTILAAWFVASRRRFKRNWGFDPVPLSYQYLPLHARASRDVSPLNPKYRMAINLWRRLPLSVTKLVGPAIVRSIG